MLRSDGAIVQESEEFNSYGDAIAHAIRYGFRPSENDWVVEGLHSVSHFRAQNTPTIVSKNGARAKAS